MTNQAFKCLGNKGNCNDNSQCTIKNINVDKGFKFSACVPKYPRGFNTEDTSKNTRVCSIANKECKVVYQKKLTGWKCIFNCKCETSKFTKQMNDLCVSIGDCGTYVNYVGDGTNNIQVSGAPDISWTEYKKYANVVKGQYVDAAKNNQFISPIGTSGINKYKPEKANSLLGEIGPIGVSFGMKIAQAYFAPALSAGVAGVLPTAGGVLTTVPGGLAGMTGVENYISNIFSVETVGSFAAASAVGIVGAFAGMMIVNLFGLKGPAASVVSIAMGAAFTGVGMAIQGQIAWMTAGIIGMVAVVIIAIVILSGWGKTKVVTVKFSCLPWQAPSSGDNCQKCNDDSSKPCTKYRCQSLGKACKLINKNTDKPICKSLVKESKPPVTKPIQQKQVTKIDRPIKKTKPETKLKKSSKENAHKK